jgi:hypothetical protein
LAPSTPSSVGFHADQPTESDADEPLPTTISSEAMPTMPTAMSAPRMNWNFAACGGSSFGSASTGATCSARFSGSASKTSSACGSGSRLMRAGSSEEGSTFGCVPAGSAGIWGSCSSLTAWARSLRR